MATQEDKKAKILEVAFDLFLNVGFDATTVRQLCQKANVEAPTLYYYFKSKKGVFFAVIDEILQDYQNLLKQHLNEASSDPFEKLYGFFKFSVKYSLEHELETKFYLRYRLFRPEDLKEDIERHMNYTYGQKENIFIEPLSECISTGVIHENIEVVFQKYVNFIDSCTFNVIFSGWRPDDTELERIWKLFYVHQLINGYSKDH